MEVLGAEAGGDYILPVDPDVWEFIHKQKKVELSAIRDAFQIDVIPMGGSDVGENVFSVRIQPSGDSREYDDELMAIAQQELTGFYESTSLSIYREYCTIPADKDETEVADALSNIRDTYTTVVSRKSDEQSEDGGQSYVFIGERAFARSARVMFNQELGLERGWWKTKRSFKKENEDCDSSLESIETEGNFGDQGLKRSDIIESSQWPEDESDIRGAFCLPEPEMFQQLRQGPQQMRQPQATPYKRQLLVDTHEDKQFDMFHRTSETNQDTDETEDEQFVDAEDGTERFEACNHFQQTDSIQLEDYTELVDSDGEEVDIRSTRLHKYKSDSNLNSNADFMDNGCHGQAEAQALVNSSSKTMARSYPIPHIGIRKVDDTIQSIMQNPKIGSKVKEALSKLDIDDVSATSDAVNELLEAQDDQCFELMSCLLERDSLNMLRKMPSDPESDNDDVAEPLLTEGQRTGIVTPDCYETSVQRVMDDPLENESEEEEFDMDEEEPDDSVLDQPDKELVASESVDNTNTGDEIFHFGQHAKQIDDEDEGFPSLKPVKKKVMSVFHFGAQSQNQTSESVRSDIDDINDANTKPNDGLSEQLDSHELKVNRDLKKSPVIMSPGENPLLTSSGKNSGFMSPGENPVIMSPAESSEPMSTKEKQTQPSVITSPNVTALLDIKSPEEPLSNNSSQLQSTITESAKPPEKTMSLPKKPAASIPMATRLVLSSNKNSSQRLVEREDGSTLLETDGCLCASCADIITGSVWTLPCKHTVCAGCLSSLGRTAVKDCPNCGAVFKVPN